MYEGKSVASLAEITDAERRYYLDQVQRSILEAPLEFVNFHFILSGVTRGFTHQMVRQRTATYTQESTRFAVKEDVPVGLPPSLVDTIPWTEYVTKISYEYAYVQTIDEITEIAIKHASPAQLWRKYWDQAVDGVDVAYNILVDAGMPAEDARGLLPTNLLTRINYNSSLRGLRDHAGVRLCTQAQYEWRQVWTEMLKAMREYGQTVRYEVDTEDGGEYRGSAWQFNALADTFKPICYKTGKCEFMANVDRHCSIRERVNKFHSLGIPSNKWDDPWHQDVQENGGIIDPSEWMMEGTARVR